MRGRESLLNLPLLNLLQWAHRTVYANDESTVLRSEPAEDGRPLLLVRDRPCEHVTPSFPVIFWILSRLALSLSHNISRKSGRQGLKYRLPKAEVQIPPPTSRYGRISPCSKSGPFDNATGLSRPVLISVIPILLDDVPIAGLV